MDKYEKKLREELQDEAADYEVVAWIEREFPELRESEDERIRKELIEYHKRQFENNRDQEVGLFHKDALAYLEKQKEQKPILEVFGFKVGDAVRLKDGDGRKHIIKSFEEVEGLHGPNFYQVEFEDNSARDGIYPGEEYPNGYYTQMEKFDEEQKPAEWSEEDERMLSRCIKSVECLKQFADSESYKAAKDVEMNWLKSLRPQPHTVSIKDATKFGNPARSRWMR